MSVHDEFEQSVSGKRRGLHPLAWLAIAFSIVAVLGNRKIATLEPL